MYYVLQLSKFEVYDHFRNTILLMCTVYEAVDADVLNLISAVFKCEAPATKAKRDLGSFESYMAG